MSQTAKEEDTFESQLTLNKEDELSLLKKATLRCQVPSNKEFLQLLHEKCNWIPGSENIRPAPKAKEDKVEYLNNIQFNYESGKDYVYDSVFGCKTKKNEEGKLYVKNKDLLKKTVFCANLFPYDLPINTKHYVIWYSGYKNNWFTKQQITSDIDLQIKNMVKHNNYDFIWYLNPKMTVPNVPHVQVFWIEDKNAKIITKNEEIKQEEEKKMFDSDVLSVNINNSGDNDRVRISVTSPPLSPHLDRNPVVVCCVVDVSGSMNTNATIKGEQNDGLTILDLVKHSIKTIIHCLSEKDYVSIVSYSDKAKVESILCRMTKGNRAKTLAAVEGLQPAGCTNLWDGLLNGLQTLRNNQDTAIKNISLTNCAVLLFTDGLPNVNPPKGELQMLENYIDENGLICTINTYGFGYSLNTQLLNQIALKGNGTFSFIPDSSFVGTIFVNSISNFAANAAKNVLLKIETNTKQYECLVIGGYENIDTSWGVQINLGNLQYGQNKDIILQFKSNQQVVSDNEQHEGKEGTEKKIFEVDKNSLNYISLRNGVNIKCAAGVINIEDKNDKLLDIHYYRLKCCDTLRMCMKLMKRNDMNDAQKELKNLLKEIESNKKLSKNKYVKDLIKDLEGQAFEAISTTVAHNKWGKHYLPSLIFAHLHQYNSNFKDPGVQHYGGKLFNDIRDKADKIFIKLPLNVPVRNVPSNKTKHGKKNKKGKSSTYSKPKPVNMANYYNASGVCFYGNCNVLMNDFSLKAVKNLCVNDIVSGGSKIKCVLKYECEDNKTILSTIGSLKITPFHPIVMNNEWVFPNDVCDTQKEEYIEDGYVYNFVLDTNHILNVNGIQCCTLGHGFNSNSVIYHQYFGTDRVIDDLKKFNGWKNGEIILSKCQVKRDLNSNLVNKIQP